MAQDQYRSFGQSAKAVSKYYMAAFADRAIGNVMTKAIFPAVLHHNPRYFTKGKGGFLKRTGYAISQEFITRNDDGRTVSTHRSSWEMRLRQRFQIFTVRLLTEALGRPPTRGQQISLDGLQHHEGVVARRTPQAFRSLKAVLLGSRWKQFGMRSENLDLTAAA